MPLDPFDMSRRPLRTLPDTPLTPAVSGLRIVGRRWLNDKGSSHQQRALISPGQSIQPVSSSCSAARVLHGQTA